MKCIYCKSDIDETNKSEEHVFPQSFGCPDTWIIYCVCKKCNIGFGKTLERFLAGDSIEGLWRLQKIGSRSKKHITQTRINIRVPNDCKYGEFRGAIVYADFSKKDSLSLPSQILVKDDVGNRKFFLIEDLEKQEIREEFDKYKDKGFWILSHNASAEEEAIEKLKQFGINFKLAMHGRLPTGALEANGGLEVIIDGIIDKKIFRAIAKISLNYLAKVKGPLYVLDARFDSIREYIKTGVTKEPKVVEIKKGHILTEETNNKYFFEGHIFIVQTEGNQIIGKVSLSNTFTFYYTVNLGVLDVWYDLKSGHAYSLQEDKIIELFSPTMISVPKPFLNRFMKR